MNANISIESFEVDTIEDIVRSLELSNGQKFQIWQPKYIIETVENNGSISAKVISLEGESFTIFAVDSEGNASTKEVDKDNPVDFEARDFKDLTFTFVNRDGLTAFKPSGSYPIEQN